MSCFLIRRLLALRSSIHAISLGSFLQMQAVLMFRILMRGVLIGRLRILIVRRGKKQRQRFLQRNIHLSGSDQASGRESVSVPLLLLAIVPVSQLPNVLDRLSDVVKLAGTRIVGSRMLIDSHHDDASPLHERYNRAWHFLELASDCYCSSAPVRTFDRMPNRPKDGHLRRESGDILVSLRHLPGGFLVFGDHIPTMSAAAPLPSRMPR